MRIAIGLGLAKGGKRGGTAFSVAFTGLIDGVAQIGSHASIGYTITPDNGTETVAWGTAPGDDTYGTGASPTDFAASDGDILYLTVTDGENTVRRTAPVRYAAPVNTDPPEIQIVNDLPPDFLLGFGEIVTVSQAGVWVAPGSSLLQGYAYFDGDSTYTLIPSTSAVDYTIDQGDSGLTLVRYERRISSGGDVTVYSNAISVETFTAAASTGSPTISAPNGFDVGQVITMASGGEAGNPSPAVVLQLLGDGEELAGKSVNGSAGNVTIPLGIEGQLLSVRKTLTGPLNASPIEVIGDTFGPVTAPSVAELDNLAVGTQTADGLPIFYTVTGETSVKFVVTPTGTIGALPVTGLAAEITAGTVSGALSYLMATLTPLDDATSLDSFSPVGYIDDVDLHVLVAGGGDGDVYLVGSNFELNLLEAPIITPASGGLTFVNPLLKAPVITPAEGGLIFGV